MVRLIGAPSGREFSTIAWQSSAGVVSSSSPIRIISPRLHHMGGATERVIGNCSAKLTFGVLCDQLVSHDPKRGKAAHRPPEHRHSLWVNKIKPR